MDQADHQLRNWQRWSLLVAAVGVGVCAAISWEQPGRIWAAYLPGFLACWLVCMGGMGLLAIGNLTGGRWAVVARPFYLAANQLIVVVAILFIPIGVFTERIYPWASATPGSEAAPAADAGYLETVFFCQRAAGYFILWLGLSWLLSAVSRLDMPPASTPAMRRAGAISLVLLVPTATFAAFDWGMSLEPRWYSSIYGALLTACGVLAAHALAVCGLVTTGDEAVNRLLDSAPGLENAAESTGLQGSDQQAVETSDGRSTMNRRVADIYNDLGNLLLAFLMVTTYFAFSQFLIIWSGNLPGEITWYLRRLGDGWQWLALTIVVLHFAVPFLLLLSRDFKRAPHRLRRISVLLATMYLANLYWMIAPALPFRDTAGHVLIIAAMAALCGGWMTAFFWQARRVLRTPLAAQI
jgi:hypothetical protein